MATNPNNENKELKDKNPIGNRGGKKKNISVEEQTVEMVEPIQTKAIAKDFP